VTIHPSWGYFGCLFGQLGIDIDTRNYYILDGKNRCISGGLDPPKTRRREDAEYLTALTGSDALTAIQRIYWMCFALSGSAQSYIIYIKTTSRRCTILTWSFFLSSWKPSSSVDISFLLSLVLSRRCCSDSRHDEGAEEWQAAIFKKN
jgi:hypothetical protein